MRRLLVLFNTEFITSRIRFYAHLCEHEMPLIDRIDLALQRAGLTRSDLAHALNLSLPAISRLGRRPGSSMKPDNVAHAAKALRCDLYWLCTGEGGEYVPEASPEHEHSCLAREIASWVDAMPDRDRDRVFALVYQMTRGNWPAFPDAQPLNGSHAPAQPPTLSHPLRATRQRRPKP
jgi:transcriptional regulator with XRE-family HTH domain